MLLGHLRIGVTVLRGHELEDDPHEALCGARPAKSMWSHPRYPAAFFDFTTSWQQFTVLLDRGDGGAAPIGGIAIDPTWGYQGAQWLPTQVYGATGRRRGTLARTMALRS